MRQLGVMAADYTCEQAFHLKAGVIKPQVTLDKLIDSHYSLKLRVLVNQERISYKIRSHLHVGCYSMLPFTKDCKGELEPSEVPSEIENSNLTCIITLTDLI